MHQTSRGSIHKAYFDNDGVDAEFVGDVFGDDLLDIRSAAK